MRLPGEHIPYEILEQHVMDLHNHSPIQLRSDTDSMGNCATFSVSLTTSLAAKHFPNGSNLAGHVPHRIQYSPQAHINVISPPDRIELSLACPQQPFSSFEALVNYVRDPANNVLVATVTGIGHVFNIVNTDKGVKIADAQYGFVCDPADLESILRVASQNEDRIIAGQFGLINIANHDPTFAHVLGEFDSAMANFSTTPQLVERIRSHHENGWYEDQRDMQGIVFDAITDPEVLNATEGFSAIGYKYSGDPLQPSATTTAVDIKAGELELSKGQWCTGIDDTGLGHIYLGTAHGILDMIPDHATLREGHEINHDLHIIASSHSLDLTSRQRTSIDHITQKNVEQTFDLTGGFEH